MEAKSKAPQGLTALSVQGYKSLAKPTRLELKPLTILAGANSSGKSSIFQPALLFKQTLDATYDPGPLLLNGPHVRFTSSEQFLSKTHAKKDTATVEMAVGFEIGAWRSRVDFRYEGGEIRLAAMAVRDLRRKDIELKVAMDEDAMRDCVAAIFDFNSSLVSHFQSNINAFRIERSRCFLLVHAKPSGIMEMSFGTDSLAGILRRIIHVPGLRGIPARAYPVTAVGDTYQGPFDSYTATIVAHWQREGSTKIGMLRDDLASLGLTSRVEAKLLDETQVEIKVGRLPHGRKGGAQDMVSIADVGFGVSQALPVLVALLAADPGQTVIIEQPELHLHPKAQAALGGVFAEAARRGVQVIVETHSAHFLLAIQTLVATGELDPALVGLQWFTRDPDTGLSTMTTAELDRHGAFGDWPEDFSDTLLRQQNAYLDAAEAGHGQP